MKRPSEGGDATDAQGEAIESNLHKSIITPNLPTALSTSLPPSTTLPLFLELCLRCLRLQLPVASLLSALLCSAPPSNSLTSLTTPSPPQIASPSPHKLSVLRSQLLPYNNNNTPHRICCFFQVVAADHATRPCVYFMCPPLLPVHSQIAQWGAQVQVFLFWGGRGLPKWDFYFVHFAMARPDLGQQMNGEQCVVVKVG